MFQQKLSLASTGNLQNLASVYQTAKAFGQTRDLWISVDPILRRVVDTIVDTARRAYVQATTQGMGVSGPNGYASFLTNMDGKLEAMDARGPYKNLDPQASNALDALRRSVQKARSEFVPVGIPGPQKPKEVKLPEDTIHANPPSGAAYKAQEADPEALQNAVHGLVEKNNPTGPSTWTSRDWQSMFDSE